MQNIIKGEKNLSVNDLIKEGEELFSEGKIEEAEKCFLSLLAKNSEDVEALNNLGVIHHFKGNFEKAEDSFLKALAAKDDCPDALLNLADLYQNTKRWEEAAVQLEKYIAMDNKDPNIFNQLSVVYLEMGHTEKAQGVLEISLELNQDQQTVRDSLKALEEKRQTPKAELRGKPLNILFVQEAPCIRNYKMATALRSRGHRVSLAYTKARLSQMYRGLTDDVYDDSIQLQSHRHLWDISKDYDIVHCHNEPDILTVAALAGEAPVVHDTHDLISLRATDDQNLAYFEGVANRGAAGRVYSTPYQMEEAKKLYGISGPSLVYYNYASEADLPARFLPKLSEKNGNVHMVYEGGIGGNTHRDFRSLFVDLAKKGIHIHIYPTFFNQEIAQYFSAHKTIHYYHPLSPKQIMEEMTQYDFGIIPFNLEKGNKRFLDSTIANKLFEYLAARLPVIASPLQSYVDYFKKNLIGITFENAQDIIGNIPKLKEIAEKTDFSKQIFTYEGEIGRLETFYEKIIVQVARPEGDRGRQRLQVNSQAVPCRICGNNRTKEIDKINNLSVIFCQECEGYFIHPMPSDEFLRKWYSEEEKKKRWNNDINLAIKANHEQNRYNYEEYFRIASETLNLDGRGKVLEIGCYSGLFLKKFKELGYECKGIDLNQGFVKYGREHYGLDLECGTIFDLKFTKNSFDIIIFHQLLEHLNDPHSFLREIRRILKDDGHIFFSVPNVGSILYRLEKKHLNDFVGHRFIEIPNHLFYFSKHSLAVLLRKTGFNTVLLNSFGRQDLNENYLKEMKADDYSIAEYKRDLLRKNTKNRWRDVEDYISKKVLNTIHKESEFLAKNLDELTGLIAVAKKSSDEGQEKTSEATSAVRKQGIQKPFSVIKKDKIFLPSIKDIDLLESQYWDKKKILEHQNVLLENLIRQAFYHVPFWKKEMRCRGLKPEHIQTYEDLKKLPVVNKSIMKDRGKDFIADNADQFVFSRGNTGGSTGRPFNYLISEEQAESIYSTQRRGWSWAGWKGNDRLLTIAGGGLGPQGGKKIEVFGFTEETAISVYKEILSYNAHFYRGLPYLMDLFCSYLEKLELNEHIRGKASFLTSEVLLDSQRQRISKHLGEVFDTYGVNDGGSNAMECELHSGFHLSHEIFLLELLSAENQRVDLNQEGIITCTNLYNLVMPWIRYKSDDLARVTHDRCACGRTLPLIRDLKGRVTDYLTTPNAVINGTELCNMINHLPMRAYQFIQNEKRTILVKIVKDIEFSKKDEEYIHSQIEKLDEHVSIRFEYVEDIPLTKGGKFKYVINNIGGKKTHSSTSKAKFKDKPKICHIGGAHSIHNLNVYLELEKRGYDQFFISYPFSESILPKNVNVYIFPYRSYDDPNWISLDLENKLKHFLSEIFKKEKPEIIHGHSLAYTCAPVWMAKEFFSIPSIVVPWSFDDLLHPTPNSFKYEKLCLDAVDMVLGTNITTKEMLVKLFDMDIKKWAHWRPGIINNIFKRDRVDAGHPTILSCRGVGPEYLQHLLLEAMPAVIKKYPNVELTMLIGQTVTGREKYFDFLKNKVRELNIEKNCCFISRPLSQRELALEMNRSDVAFTMYKTGGNANTAMEACMCGSILLHSNLKSSTDVIFEDGVNALLADNNVSSITDKLVLALDHTELKDDYYDVNRRKLFPYTNDYLTPLLCGYYDELFK